MFVLTRPASNSLDLFSDISPALLSFFPPFNFWKKKAMAAFVYHGLDTGPSWAVLHTSTLTCPPVISRFLHLPLIFPWLAHAVSSSWNTFLHSLSLWLNPTWISRHSWSNWPSVIPRLIFGAPTFGIVIAPQKFFCGDMLVIIILPVHLPI